MHLAESRAGTTWREILNSPYSLCVLLGMMLALPVWFVQYPPLVDYPDHLARAFVLAHLHDSAFKFASLYAADWGPYPYLLPDVLAVGLERVFGILIAGRVLLTIGLTALPLSTLFFLRRASPANEMLAVLALVVAYNQCFLLGFVSYTLSVSVCLLVAGIWLRYLDQPRLWVWFGLCVLTTLLYLTHLIGFGVAGIAVVGYSIFSRQSLRRQLEAIGLFAPGAFLFLSAVVTSGTTRHFNYSNWHLQSKVSGALSAFQGYSRTLDIVTILVVVSIIAVSLFIARPIRVSLPWLGVFGLLLALHLSIPDLYGDIGMLDIRLSPFLVLLALAIPITRIQRPAIIAMFCCLALIRGANVGGRFIETQERLQSLVRAISAIPAGSVVLSYAPAEDGRWAERWELHFPAYGVITRGWLLTSMFQNKGVQALTLRSDIYRGNQFNGHYLGIEPDWQLLRRDYDYIWAYKVPALDTGLSEIGDVAYSDGKLKVFRVKRSAQAAAAAAR